MDARGELTFAHADELGAIPRQPEVVEHNRH
jgi:hypothetical protein